MLITSPVLAGSPKNFEKVCFNNGDCISSTSTLASIPVSSLTATGITPATYTNATVTFDAQGRATSASNGSAGGGSGNPVEVFSNFDGIRSSPTLSISLSDAMNLTISGSTAAINIDFTSVTARGNVFNGVSQLVALDGSSQLPAVSGVNLTNLNASNLASGTVPNARLDSSSVTLVGPTVQLGTETTGVYISSINGNGAVAVSTNFAAGAVVNFSLVSSSVTLYGTSIPAASISAGSLGASVLVSSLTQVNAAAGSFTNASITVNAQGQVTTASNGPAGLVLAIGTGTAASFTTIITSPTVNISALGSQFAMTTSGTTNFWALNSSTVTLLGPTIDVSGAEITGILASTNFPSLIGDVSNSGLTVTVLDDSHNHTVATSTFAVTGGTFTVTGGTVSINGTAYRWPNARASGTQILSNAGESAGVQTLSWVADATGGGSGGYALEPATVTIKAATITAPSGVASILVSTPIVVTGVTASTLTVTSSMTVLSASRFAGAITANSTLGVTGTLTAGLINATTLNATGIVTGKKLVANGSNIGTDMIDINDPQVTSTIGAIYTGIGITYQPSDLSFPILSSGYFSIRTSTTDGTNSPKSALVLGGGTLGAGNTTDYLSINISTTGTGQGNVGINTLNPTSGLQIDGLGGLTLSSGTLKATISYSTTVAGIVISSNVQTNGSLTVVSLSTQPSTIGNGLVVQGHIEVSSTTPTLSSCGTSPSIVGNDFTGTVTVGSVAAASCTMTFAVPFQNKPGCVILSNTAIVSQTGSSTPTTFTFGGTSIVNDVVMYICGGYR